MGVETVALEDLWEHVLQALQGKINKPTFVAWVRNIYPLSLTGDTLCVAVPNSFVKDWLVKHHAEVIEAVASKFTHRKVSVQFDIVSAQGKSPVIPTAGVSSSSQRGQVRPPRTGDFSSTALNPRYTFDNFVVGRSNEFTHAAATAVAKSPFDNRYNPLFIYGGVGLGKTHLMQAIGHQVGKNMPDARVVYVSGETFLYHVVTAIREDRTAAFRRMYRGVDLWLVDDIQYIASAERTEVEFFHIFNALYDTNKQIVICSDKRPKDLQLIENRLRSRFEWGLITDIAPPDFEHRVAILQKKALNDRLEIDYEVLCYIAERIKTNIRTLEGALTRLEAHASLTHKPMGLDLTMEILEDYSTGEDSRALTTQVIQRVVSEHFAVPMDALVGKKRNRGIVRPRQIAMYLCREMTKDSFPEIAQAFGGRDHSTVIHSCEKIKADLLEDPHLQGELDELRAQLAA